MIIIDFNEDDRNLFEDFIERYSQNIIVSKSKKFIGGSELYELLIIVTPAIISSLAIVIQNMINYKKSQYVADKSNLSEIKIRIKNDKGEYEVAFKTSLLSNKADIDELTNDIIKKIKECGYEGNE